MGGGAKKKNANKAALLAQKRKKAEKKGERAASKQAKKRGERSDTLEEVLEQLNKAQEEYAEQYKVTTEASDVPSRRANATFVPCPVSNSVYLFGGEFFDGKDCHFYQDLHRYSIDKNQWTRIFSPNSPGPRSAHAMVASPADGGKLWLFGGEFASPNQTTFFHHRDLWAFDIKTQTWERFDTRIRPSARSGHRMALYKNFIVLFGGFHDTGIRTTYLSDLWLFDLNEYRWHEVQQRAVDLKPRARSGFSILPSTEGIVLHGGYCKEYQGKTAKGMPLEDSWLLKLDSVKSGIGFSSSDVKWEKKRKVGGFAPSIRSGTTMAYWATQGKGVMFGGVFDDEADEEHMTSSFYNDLYAYNIGPGRWQSLNVRTKNQNKGRRRRKPKATAANGHASEDSDSDGEASDQEDAPEESREGDSATKSEPVVNGSGAKPEPPIDLSRPVERYNAMLAVSGKHLFLYGGILERASMEATLDDFWTLDLSKLDKWTCLKQSEVLWSGVENDSDVDDDAEGEDLSESSSDDDEESDEGQEDIYEEEFVDETAARRQDKMSDAAMEDLRKRAEAFLVLSKDEKRSEDDKSSTPVPGENLRAFYERTRDWWTHKAYENSSSKGKALRRDGFALAEERYEGYRPLLMELERIQASAGHDEGEATLGATTAAGVTGVDSRHRR